MPSLQPPPKAAQWDDLPDLMSLEEVALLLRCQRQTAYNKLAQGIFPIAHLPTKKPYLFPTPYVRAFVERGEITNTAVTVQQRRRKSVA